MACLAILAGCAAQTGGFSSAAPSLHVGQVALDNGEPGIAVSIAQTQLATKPGNLDALLLRGRALAAGGQDAPAVADFRAVLASRPASVEAALGLSRLVTAADPGASEAVLAAFVTRGDANAPVWNNIGVAHDLLGRHAEAQFAYRQALAADPAMAGAEANLAHSLAIAPAGPPFRAALTARTSRPASETAWNPASWGGLVGWFIRMSTTREDELLREAEATLRTDPSNLDYRRQTVRAALQAGDGARAAKLACDTMREAPQDPSGYLMDAAVDLDRGEEREALAALLTARRLLLARSPIRAASAS